MLLRGCATDLGSQTSEISHRLPLSPIPSLPLAPGLSPLRTGLGTLQFGPSLVLTQWEAFGLYFHILQGKLRPREAKGLIAKEKARLLSPHPPQTSKADLLASAGLKWLGFQSCFGVGGREKSGSLKTCRALCYLFGLSNLLLL